jgi:D-sedoheptulose 7-phosphate isomerase
MDFRPNQKDMALTVVNTLSNKCKYVPERHDNLTMSPLTPNDHNKVMIDSFLEGIKTACDNIPREAIEAAVDAIFNAWKNRKTVFVIGNGGSASTATHLACDLAKNVTGDRPGLKAMALGDNIPLVSALTNDNGFENIYTEQLKAWLEKGDVLVALSVHGGSGRDKASAWSQNLIMAITFGKSRGAITIGITGFDGGVMKGLVDIWINTPSNETFQVEPLHVIVHHLICEALSRRIAVS